MLDSLFFDIETLPLTDEVLMQIMPPFDPSEVKVGNLKDELKITAKLNEAKENYLADFKARAALHPMTGSIAAVGFKQGGFVEIYSATETLPESELVSIALEKIDTSLAIGREVVGFNCLAFDLPFLCRRAFKHSIRPPSILRKGRWWNDNIVDLREVWLMGERQPAKGTSSLDAVAKFLGLPAKLGHGDQYGAMTAEQRREYLTRDLDVTEALYNRIRG